MLSIQNGTNKPLERASVIPSSGSILSGRNRSKGREGRVVISSRWEWSGIVYEDKPDTSRIFTVHHNGASDLLADGLQVRRRIRIGQIHRLRRDCREAVESSLMFAGFQHNGQHHRRHHRQKGAEPGAEYIAVFCSIGRVFSITFIVAIVQPPHAFALLRKQFSRGCPTGFNAGRIPFHKLLDSSFYFLDSTNLWKGERQDLPLKVCTISLLSILWEATASLPPCTCPRTRM